MNIGKYQDALSALCGVDYPYMQGDPDVDAMIELIALVIEQEATIQQQEAKDAVKNKLLAKAEAKIEALEMDNEQLKSDIANAEMNLENLSRHIFEIREWEARVKFLKKQIQAEAVKEFWGRLKEYIEANDFVKISDIDNLLKEMGLP